MQAACAADLLVTLFLPQDERRRRRVSYSDKSVAINDLFPAVLEIDVVVKPPRCSPGTLESIKAGKSFYGEVPILGTPYITGYEPIKDSSGTEIGVYYVGYEK